MRTFKEFFQAKEYNTTGEVDIENNTDLDKPSHPKTRWTASKKKCGLGGLPCSKYVAQMKETTMFKTFRQYLEGLPGYDRWKLASPGDDDVPCPECRGEGEVNNKECELCGGSGEVDKDVASEYQGDQQHYDSGDDYDHGEVGDHPNY